MCKIDHRLLLYYKLSIIAYKNIRLYIDLKTKFNLILKAKHITKKKRFPFKKKKYF